jgi:glucose/arabinose dehydrogenase
MTLLPALIITVLGMHWIPSPGAQTSAYRPAHYSISPKELPKAFASKSVLSLPKIIPPRDPSTLQAPPGFKITVFAEGLHHLRWMAAAPNGDIFCVESLRHRVIVLRDNGSGKAEMKGVFCEKLYYPFGIAFHSRYLYIANTGSVVRYRYADGQLQAEDKPETVIKGIPEKGYNQHWTRDILFDPTSTKLYLTVGSEKNVAEEPSPRACIMQYNADGTGGRVLASGLRNAVGLAFNPKTGALWCTCNERDYRGDDIAPDFITAVRDGGFYGWPYYYCGKYHDPRMPEKPALRRKTIVPDVLIQAHSAALGIIFYNGKQFPPEYQGDAFVALHGSTNRSERTGYKIIRVRFRDGKPVGGYEDFITGWMLAPDRQEVWGRPVGLLVTKDGSLLIADDANNRIYRVTYKRPTNDH